MHTYYLALLFKFLGKLGIEQNTLLKAANLPKLRLVGSLELSASELDAVFGAALELTKDPHLGLKFGSQIIMVPQGILGYAISTSATIGDALNLLTRYHRALLPSMAIELSSGDGKQTLTSRAAHDMTRELERFYTEVLYSGIITAGGMLLADQTERTNASSPLVVLLDYPAPDNTELFHRIFGPNVYFDSAHRALCIDKKDLNVAISTSNPMAQEIFRRECERLFAQTESDNSITEQVKRLMIESGSDFKNCGEIAARLNMSESTLRRHLAKEGWSFQQILDDVRYKLAREYLKGTLLPVADIASLLGFSDSASFRKAYRRWSNTTPSQTRDSAADT